MKTRCREDGGSKILCSGFQSDRLQFISRDSQIDFWSRKNSTSSCKFTNCPEGKLCPIIMKTLCSEDCGDKFYAVDSRETSCRNNQVDCWSRRNSTSGCKFKNRPIKGLTLPNPCGNSADRTNSTERVQERLAGLQFISTHNQVNPWSKRHSTSGCKFIPIQNLPIQIPRSRGNYNYDHEKRNQGLVLACLPRRNRRLHP